MHLHIFIYVCVYIYIYIYIYIQYNIYTRFIRRTSMFEDLSHEQIARERGRACVRDSDREGERGGETERESFSLGDTWAVGCVVVGPS